MTDTSYHTLLERRIRAINQAHSRGVVELVPFDDAPALRVRDGSRPVLSPNLSWENLYWWLDGWLTAHEIRIPTARK